MHRLHRTVLTLVLVSAGALATVPFQAQNAPSAAEDNSRQNAAISITADLQPNGRVDRRTLAQVRKALIADNTLSVYAHNVKVIVIAGKVTLEGPVHSEEERQQVLIDAGSVVNSMSIVNKLTIP